MLLLTNHFVKRFSDKFSPATIYAKYEHFSLSIHVPGLPFLWAERIANKEPFTPTAIFLVTTESQKNWFKTATGMTNTESAICRRSRNAQTKRLKQACCYRPDCWKRGKHRRTRPGASSANLSLQTERRYRLPRWKNAKREDFRQR